MKMVPLTIMVIQDEWATIGSHRMAKVTSKYTLWAHHTEHQYFEWYIKDTEGKRVASGYHEGKASSAKSMWLGVNICRIAADDKLKELI
jgi:hypothetical protein